MFWKFKDQTDGRSPRLQVVAVVAVAVVAALAMAMQTPAEFAMAGGGPQRTGYVDALGPLIEPEIVWEHGLGIIGESNTQPVLDAAGNLYVTAAPNRQADWPETTQPPRGIVVSLTPDGVERWRYTWHWSADDPAHRGTWSQLSGPVITRDGRVVMGQRHGALRCWNKDTGALLWERDLSPDSAPITSTPVVDRDGFVYLHYKDRPTVHKVDPAGNDVWVHRFVDGAIGHTSSPALSGDERTLYIGRSLDEVSYLYAIYTVSGTFRWAWSPETASDHSFAWGLPVVGAEGTVYIQDESCASLYAVRDLGRIHAGSWTYKREGSDAPRLMALDDTAIFSSYNADGHPVVFAINLDGTERWSRALGEGRDIGGFVLARNGLYFGLNGTGKVVALDPRSGETLWVKQVGAEDASFSEGLTLSSEGVLYAAVSATPVHPDEPSIVALGERAARNQGFANRWLLCGPFDNTGMEGHDRIYEPEKELDFTAIYFGKNDLPAKWRPNTTADEMAYVRLADEYPATDWASAYALCWVRNDGPPIDVDFRAGSNDALKIFLNDDVIWEHKTERPASADDDVIPVTLPSGVSTIMLKVSQAEGDWGFFFRITERGGRTYPAGLTLSDGPMLSQTSLGSTPPSPQAAPEG